MKISKKSALQMLDYLKRDIEMLESEEWVPDSDSCYATLGVIATVREYVLSSMEKDDVGEDQGSHS